MIHIEAELKRHKGSSKISSYATLVESALYNDDDSALSRLHLVLNKTAELSHSVPEISAKMEPLSQAKSLIEDALYELRSYVVKIEVDPAHLESLEQRLSD